MLKKLQPLPQQRKLLPLLQKRKPLLHQKRRPPLPQLIRKPPLLQLIRKQLTKRKKLMTIKKPPTLIRKRQIKKKLWKKAMMINLRPNMPKQFMKLLKPKKKLKKLNIQKM